MRITTVLLDDYQQTIVLLDDYTYLNKYQRRIICIVHTSTTFLKVCVCVAPHNNSRDRTDSPSAAENIYYTHDVLRHHRLVIINS
jgi:hypothetical protein